MAKYCEDCGCRVYSAGCTNCNEVQYIGQQYVRQEMEMSKELLDQIQEDQQKQLTAARVKKEFE